MSDNTLQPRNKSYPQDGLLQGRDELEAVIDEVSPILKLTASSLEFYTVTTLLPNRRMEPMYQCYPRVC